MGWLEEFAGIFRKRSQNHRDADFKALLGEVVSLRQELLSARKWASGAQIGAFVSENERERQLFWDFKRQPVSVSYAGRTFPLRSKVLPVDVRLFVTPQDFGISSQLAINSLMGFPGECPSDEGIVGIYLWHQKRFMNYKADKESVGLPEYWLFPFETRAVIGEGGGVDCEDLGNSLASHLIAAGVPAYRVRCVAGIANSGYGHQTVYVLDKGGLRWHHLNSTDPYENIKGAVSLGEFPVSNEPSDALGIKDVWFSYNSVFSWSEFESKYSEKVFTDTVGKMVKVGGGAGNGTGSVGGNGRHSGGSGRHRGSGRVSRRVRR